jgi:hypothetical protein
MYTGWLVNVQSFVAESQNALVGQSALAVHEPAVVIWHTPMSVLQ